MKQAEKRFYATMNTMETAAIIDAMRQTWNQPEGEIFREIGFEILENREGEEKADEIYNDLWHEMAA